MRHYQITASMAKEIALKLGAELNDEEADIFSDGYNAAMSAPRGEAAPLLDSDGKNTDLGPRGNGPVSQPYKLPQNSLTDAELEMMSHGDNPQANAYRELLALRRKSPVIPGRLNIRAVAALREAVRNKWLKSEDFADKVYWKNMHDIANEIVSAMIAAAPQQEG